MANPTQIPAFRATMGDWTYYVCLMSYAQAARQINFAFEIGGNKDLSTMIQRGISERTKEITEYLLNNEHHFLGALVVAAWGGAPQYVEMEMATPSELLPSLDEGFGVLVFDGSQSYFALDGQHRLKAIKDAVKQNPEIGKEQIAVLMVPHLDTAEGRERTRRLFTNINRTAKSTTKGENIALDEDDAFAILSRDFITRHDLLARPGLVRVFVRPPSDSDGVIKLASLSVPKGDPRAWTSIGALYEILKALGFDLDPSIHNQNIRPSDDALTSSYNILSRRIEQLLDVCGGLGEKLAAAQNVRDLRAPKLNEGKGHPFMRPAIQRAVVETVRYVIEQERVDWSEALKKLSGLTWELEAAPWNSMYSGKMLTGKENSNLLKDLLVAHIAPDTKKSIADVRREYKEITGRQYPFTAEALEENIAASN